MPIVNKFIINEIILNLIRLFEANGEEYVNNLPLQLSGESVYFTDDEKAINTMSLQIQIIDQKNL